MPPPYVKQNWDGPQWISAFDPAYGVEGTDKAVIAYERNPTNPTPKINIICIGGPHDGTFANVDPTLEFPVINGAQYERVFMKFHEKHFFALVFYNPRRPILKDDIFQMLLAGYRGAKSTDMPEGTTKVPTGRKFDFSQ